jgi:hypothetical protein
LERCGEGPWDQILPKVRPPVSVHCSADVGLSQLRAIVKWSRSSPQRRQKWKEEQKAEQRDGDRAVMLILDVRTRWSSTFAMLQRALRFRATIDRVTRLHDGPTELNGLKMLAEEWKIIDVTCRWLKTYADATLELSLGRFPTASSAFLTFSWLMEDVKSMLR